MKLFSNSVSSASSRLRIALAIKKLAYEREEITIFGVDARSRTQEYRALNPQGLVPALLTDEGVLLTQSLAIIEYLDERFPDPALMPRDATDRAIARSVALVIAAEVHALLPPRVAAKLSEIPGVNSDVIGGWARHWITEGLTAIESLLSRRHSSKYAVGDAPSIADICLFPALIGAERVGLPIDRWPRVAGIFSNLKDHAAFVDNAPAPRT